MSAPAREWIANCRSIVSAPTARALSADSPRLVGVKVSGNPTARVVDQDLHRTERPLGGLEDLAGRGGVGQVRLDRDRARGSTIVMLGSVPAAQSA